jgi:hypothetical protein
MILRERTVKGKVEIRLRDGGSVLVPLSQRDKGSGRSALNRQERMLYLSNNGVAGTALRDCRGVILRGYVYIRAGVAISYMTALHIRSISSYTCAATRHVIWRNYESMPLWLHTQITLPRAIFLVCPPHADPTLMQARWHLTSPHLCPSRYDRGGRGGNEGRFLCYCPYLAPGERREYLPFVPSRGAKNPSAILWSAFEIKVWNKREERGDRYQNSSLSRSFLFLFTHSLSHPFFPSVRPVYQLPRPHITQVCFPTSMRAAVYIHASPARQSQIDE